MFNQKSHLVICCTTCFNQFLTRSYIRIWLRIAPFTLFRVLAHGGCHRSTGGAYSSLAADLTSCIFRGRFCHAFIFVYFFITKLIAERNLCIFTGMQFQTILCLFHETFCTRRLNEEEVKYIIRLHIFMLFQIFWLYCKKFAIVLQLRRRYVCICTHKMLKPT